MVKITKNNKKPEKNILRKVSNGIKKEGKQKVSIKTEKNADGDLKKKLMKEVKKVSKDLPTNVRNVVQPKGIGKEGKQKVSIKAKKNGDGELKIKSMKEVKDSKDLQTNVSNVVQPTVIGKDKQNVSKKTKKTTNGEPKNKIMESKHLPTNVLNVVQPRVNKIKKKINTPKGKEESSETEKVTKKIAKNKPNKQVGNIETNISPINKNFKATSFDQGQFESIVNLENIEKVCKALKKLVEGEVNEKKTSIFSDYRFFLNVTNFKIPNCPKRMVKLKLKHSLVDPNEDDILFIVSDLKRGSKIANEPTIQHYEDLLKDCGVTGLKIMPFNQLRNEYTTFEAKRKLANTYDYYLCDGRIAGHAVGFCGKSFQKARATIHSVRLNVPQNYKINIERALKRTSFKQLHKGDLISIPVGSHRFTINQLGENIKCVIDQLKEVFPGGYANIRNMYLRIDIKGTSSLPLYINLAGPPAKTPNVVGLREKRMIKLKKEANEVLSKFSLSKTGDFVKLNKSQVERKQHIRETRAVLLSTENHDDDIEIPPTKKFKKNKAASIEANEAGEDENVEDSSDDIIDSEVDDNEDDDSEHSHKEE